MSLKKDLNYILNDDKAYLEDLITDYDLNLMNEMLEDAVNYDEVIRIATCAKMAKAQLRDCNNMLNCINNKSCRNSMINRIIDSKLNTNEEEI